MTKSHKNSKTRPKINVSAGLWRTLLGDWGCEYNYDVICKDISFFFASFEGEYAQQHSSRGEN